MNYTGSCWTQDENTGLNTTNMINYIKFNNQYREEANKHPRMDKKKKNAEN